MNLQTFVPTPAALTVKCSDGCRWMLPHPVRSRSLYSCHDERFLAVRRFNWSHFCQARQAITHLRIQGVPADKAPTRTHYSDEIPGNHLISHEHCSPLPRLIGSCHSLDQRLNERRFPHRKPGICLHRVALPTSLIR